MACFCPVEGLPGTVIYFNLSLSFLRNVLEPNLKLLCIESTAHIIQLLNMSNVKTVFN